jgi:hypothetical protein
VLFRKAGKRAPPPEQLKEGLWAALPQLLQGFRRDLERAEPRLVIENLGGNHQLVRPRTRDESLNVG